jgi:hypothetical protein
MKLKLAAIAVLLFAPMVAHADYLIGTPDSLMNNGCDYLVITHGDFTSAAYPLCRLRDSLGLNVRMAEVSLIYSTFDSGPRPDRIKSFLRQVYYHWSPRPTYVLLVGDACRDSTLGDYVPSKLFPKFSYYYANGLTQHASDNWYVQLEGQDSIPDLVIGRLPVKSAVRAESLVSKIIHYETTPDTGTWTRTIVTAAADDFAAIVTDIETTFFRPAGDSVFRIVEAQGNSSYLRQKSRTGIRQGAVLTYSTTHGTQPPAWIGVIKTLFNYQDVDSLTNYDRLTISLGCG